MRHMAFAAGLILGSMVVAAEDRNDWQQPERVLSDLGVKAGTCVADIGCGSGYFALSLAKSVGERGIVFAVDVSAESLNSLKKHAERDHLTNVVTVVSEAEDTKLQPESVDMALFCNVLHEVPVVHHGPLLRSAAKALKPGGILHLLDWRKSRDIKFDPYDELIPREELVKLGIDAGLILDAEFHYLKYQVFLRFRKPEE